MHFITLYLDVASISCVIDGDHNKMWLPPNPQKWLTKTKWNKTFVWCFQNSISKISVYKNIQL